ncbi:DUF3048 domain-containing protein [Quadrisphaera sp. GCM10027208]|uniref:DUF3048 domain-containing protein n=1 Tax=Quadrisphaera sp. GCM10027208 TaxID=3273423 RepID=UPI00361F0272
MRTRPRLLTVLAASVVVVAAVAACSSPGPQPQATATPSTAAPTQAAEPGGSGVRAPLTGVEVADPSVLERPAVAVKVSDVRQAHPQVGVDRADLVLVEPIGASYTRLAAVFHSELPQRVGPVRSVRPMDAALLSPLRPVFANTMGAEWVLRYVEDTGDLENLGSLTVHGTGAYPVDGDRPAPDHVLVDPARLLELAESTRPPAPYLEHAEDVAGATAVTDGQPARRLTVPYGAQWTVSWTWDDADGRYERSEPWGPHVTADGDRVGAQNVVVLFVESRREKLAAGSGQPVDVLQVVDASGELLVLSGGSAVTGTWRKGAPGEPFELVTDDGGPVRLAPGRTWVEMPRPGAAVDVS